MPPHTSVSFGVDAAGTRARSAPGTARCQAPITLGELAALAEHVPFLSFTQRPNQVSAVAHVNAESAPVAATGRTVARPSGLPVSGTRWPAPGSSASPPALSLSTLSSTSSGSIVRTVSVDTADPAGAAAGVASRSQPSFARGSNSNSNSNSSSGGSGSGADATSAQLPLAQAPWCTAAPALASATRFPAGASLVPISANALLQPPPSPLQLQLLQLHALLQPVQPPAAPPSPPATTPSAVISIPPAGYVLRLGSLPAQQPASAAASTVGFVAGGGGAAPKRRASAFSPVAPAAAAKAKGASAAQVRSGAAPAAAPAAASLSAEVVCGVEALLRCVSPATAAWALALAAALAAPAGPAAAAAAAGAGAAASDARSHERGSARRCNSKQAAEVAPAVPPPPLATVLAAPWMAAPPPPPSSGVRLTTAPLASAAPAAAPYELTDPQVELYRSIVQTNHEAAKRVQRDWSHQQRDLYEQIMGGGGEDHSGARKRRRNA
ncbi:hypothetical protein HYH03_011777 [Edaphochlamys debaryana]|uniref:Uncharacterized protein n=1 Tax=Edaphochlamys debaryana TaxID=47281 RepID=A0A835XWJ6_9CHLO|nr:hypothetical protein HYH03_011777 [Edaphochlamys debaryana]|eukprot:KAG2489666.1 hypothetical protein HYH03_011777 [Edaphochlamys debaryana]